MKHLSLFTLIVLLGLSQCSPNEYNPEMEAPEINNEPEILWEYSISKEEALSELKSLLSSWCNNGLRNAEEDFTYRRILSNLNDYPTSKIRTIGGDLHSLRTEGDSIERNKNLLHLINFDDGGYAILSADKRIPAKILAITEAGNILPEDFFDQDSIITEDRMRKLDPDFRFYDKKRDDYRVAQNERSPAIINKMVYSYARDYAEFPCGSRADKERRKRPINDDGTYGDKYAMPELDHSDCDDSGGGGGNDDLRVKYEYGNWIVQKEVTPLITTQWGQWYPFNMYTPKRKRFVIIGQKQNAPAGCVPIAIAQIMTALKYPPGLTLNDIVMDWDALARFKARPQSANTNDRPLPANINEMAGELLIHIGSRVDAWYFYDATFAFPSEAKKFFKERLGLQSVYRLWVGLEYACLPALDDHCPVFISSISGIANGHAWVIDGYRQQERDVIVKNAHKTKILNTIKEKRTLVHCNFGWSGVADGYYYFGIFRTGKGPEEKYTGDKNHDNDDDLDFDTYTSIITFKNPNKSTLP